ncbi:MAG: ATP-binding protein [Acidimicrobiales bacterium]
MVAAVPSTTSPGRPALVERETQLAALEALFDGAASGHGGLAFLSGEAGAGKTALVGAFLAATGRARRLVGSCDGVSTPRPLGPIHDFAAALHADVVALLEHDGPIRQRLFDAVLAEVGRETPTVLVIEDVHWSDNATLDLMRYLGRRLGAVGALLIATYREDQVGPFDPLRIVVGDLATLGWTHHISVPPLSAEGVARLAAGHQVDPGALHRLTGGNPFYVSEVLASWQTADVPGSVRDAIRARIARLTKRGHRALDTAAVLGSRVEPWLLAAVTGEDALGIDECLAAALLVRQDETIVFRHELTRLTVLDDLPMVRGVALHRRALRFLEESDGGDPSRLAYHAEGAADGEAVMRHAPRAAVRATTLYAHTAAIAQLRRTLRFGHGLPDEERASILETMSYELFLTNRLDEAYESRLRGVAIRQATGDLIREGISRRYLSRVAWFIGRGEEAWENARRAIEILEPLDAGRELAMAWGNLGHLHMIDQEVEPALEWGHRALELGRRLNDPEVIAYALNNIGSAELQAGIPDGTDKLLESLRIARENNLQEHIDRALFNLGETDLLYHRYATAERHLLACLEYTASCDLERCQLLADAARALVRLETGHWDEAEGLARAMLAHPRGSPHGRVVAQCVLARLSMRRGNDAHDSLLAEAEAIASTSGGISSLAEVAAAAAEAAWLMGDREAVGRTTERAHALATEIGAAACLAEVAIWRWRSGLLEASPEGLPEPFALEIAGRAEEAAAAWEARDNPYRAALARASSSDPGQVRRAYDAMVGLGATAVAELLARRLRALGARVPRGPRRTTRAHPARLTEREAEIAELVATGLTNRQIADRLVVSEKTIGHHVSAVLGKLDVRRRTEVASVLHGERPLAN